MKQPQERKIDWNKLHPWHKAAFDHGSLNQSWFAMAPDSPEYAAWADYFRKLGWAPTAFRTVTPDKEVTMPTRWPEWFPTDIGSVAKERPRTLTLVD